MSIITLTRLNDLVYRLHTEQGDHVGNLKLIQSVWKFKAIGYDRQGEIIPGGGPLTHRHNMTFSTLNEVEINVRLNADS